MYDKQALIDLKAKVETGEWSAETTANTDNAVIDLLLPLAYDGSVDAALSLLEAVLPGWHWNLAPGYCHVMPPVDNGDQEAITGVHYTPARALLLAILEALISQA